MRYLFPLILGLAGVAVLLNLGIWQMHRLAWKRDMLAHIEARIVAPPGAVPLSPDPDRDRYAPVEARGRIGPGELHVLDSIKDVGPGWRIIAPFSFDGRTVLLDRGFVRDGRQDADHPGGEVTVVGNLSWPDDRQSSTPANNVAENRWFARDVGQMAEVLGTEPVLIVARSDTGGGVTAVPVGIEGIPNDHLQYAITWFSLAVVWAGMTVLLLWRISRRTIRTEP